MKIKLMEDMIIQGKGACRKGQIVEINDVNSKILIAGKRAVLHIEKAKKTEAKKA